VQLEVNILLQSARHRLSLSRPIFASRDLSMAQNVSALLELEGSQAKAVLWAHNAHAARADLGGETVPVPTMGSRLHELFGHEQVVVGFAFNQGSFQAIRLEGGLANHTVPPAPEGSLDRTLAAVNIPALILDLTTVPAGPIADYLAARPQSRCIGAVYSAEDTQRYWQSGDPRSAYDLLAFIERTTAARPNRVARRSPALKGGLKTAATNLELAGCGEVPEDWDWSGGRHAYPHSIQLSQEGSPSRGRSVQIARRWAPWRWGEGRLEQTLSAEAWRGKRLRFAGSIRAEVAGPGSGAQLYIEVRPQPPEGVRWGMPAAAAAIINPPARSPRWGHAVEIDVPEEAHSIVIGLALAGDGAASFADLELGSGEDGQPLCHAPCEETPGN
jgi:erythromycin esterase